MRTTFLIGMACALSAMGQMAYQGQITGAGPLYGAAVATDGQVSVTAAFGYIEFRQWNGTRWVLEKQLNTQAPVTGLAVYKTSALAKHAGGVYAFEKIGGAWQQTQSIVLTDGTGLLGGKMISLRGNLAAVGAPNFTNGRGQVYVLGRNAAGSPWGLAQTIASPSSNRDYFGMCVSLGMAGTNGYLLVGAPYAVNASGIVYAYRQSGYTYSSVGTIPSPSTMVARFGSSIGGEAGSVLIGAPANLDFRGSAHLYDLSCVGSGFGYTARAFLTSNSPFLFGEMVALTSSYAVISSRSTLTYYTYSNGAIGNPLELRVPPYSQIWGTALATASGRILAGDSNMNAVAWYR